MEDISLVLLNKLIKKKPSFVFIIRGETNERIDIIDILKITYSNQQTFI